MSELTEHFTETLGMGADVVEFFSNRPVPEHNDYWLSQTQYVSKALGFVFVPAYIDLLIKQGISASLLLTDGFLLPMERILNSAGALEHKRISSDEHIKECRIILRNAGLTEGQIQLAENNLVNRPFHMIPARYKSLQRGNTFLYSFSGTSIDPDLVFRTWEYTVPLFLILDDFQDIAHDLVEGEENCLLDKGSINENFFELSAAVDLLLGKLKPINAALSKYLVSLKREAVARNMLIILSKGAQ